MDRSNQTTVVTLCTKNHAAVWKRTASLLPRFLEADRYLVLVPDDDVKAVAAVTDPTIEVLNESTLGANYPEAIRKACDEVGNSARYNWYLQQFLKIDLVSRIESPQVVIWDADCVPLRSIPTFDSDGNPIFWRGREYHDAYFDLIRKVLRMERRQTHSFIGPGFPIRASWVREFLHELEDINNNRPWHEVLVGEIDFSLTSGFSEFETMGTWISHRKTGWSLADYKWERRGQSLFGPAENFLSSSLTEIGDRTGISVLSFENWDRGKKISLSKRFRRVFRRARRYFRHRLGLRVS